MTITRSRADSRTRRPTRARAAVRWLLGAALLALAFGLGVALGQALEDRPQPAKPVTNISTIRPWTQTQSQP